MEPNFVKTTLRITAGLKSQFPTDSLPQIALSGRSNVGKSSLINRLIGRKSLARVSSSPGKTITVNFYEVDASFYLVDLPGYGYARRPGEDRARWSELTDGYFGSGKQKNDRIAAVAQLIDLKVGPTADDLTMLDFLTRVGIPFFVIATKADKLNKTERTQAMEKLLACPYLAGRTVIPFSAQSGEGKDEIISEIGKYLA
ncbi:MAG: ribosome biogenesis GTP-binding protein YihA/YsxC [Eubacteriales bacterium]